MINQGVIKIENKNNNWTILCIIQGINPLQPGVALGGIEKQHRAVMGYVQIKSIIHDSYWNLMWDQLPTKT